MSSPNPSPLQELYLLAGSSSDFGDRLCTIFRQEGYRKCGEELEYDGLVRLIDYLAEALGHLDPPSEAYKQCLRELRSICGAKLMLPKSYILPFQRPEIELELLSIGGFGAVYKGPGTLVGIDPNTIVCIKRPQTRRWESERGRKIFYKEAVTWKLLEHTNILPLLGITVAPFQLISKWVPGGELRRYIQENHDVDRRKLLRDVAEGLNYLHSHFVVHGDLKGANVLVEDPCHALIADFGLAKISREVESDWHTSIQRDYSKRWAAPEVIVDGNYSKEADIYSFAMVMIEVFTEAAPPILATTGDHPPRPTHPDFTDGLWELMKLCWHNKPKSRPKVSKVLEVLCDPDIPMWKQLIVLPLSTDDRTSWITSFFSNWDDIETIRRLSGSDIQPFIYTIDEVFGGLKPEIRRRCLYYLSEICGRHSLLPKPLPRPLRYDSAQTAQYGGMRATVRRGWYDGRQVAVKALRNPGSDPEQTKVRFHEGITIWKTLHHQNVLSLLGVTTTGDQFTMVSEWMTNGNANEFIEAHPEVNRLELLAGVVKGLIYLHDRGIAHGNLNGSNILIDNDGGARLAGFTLLTAIPDEPIATSSRPLDDPPPLSMEIMRWSAPEILTGGKASKAADIFALAMVFSGKEPFGTLTDPAAIVKISRGGRPPRPTHLDVSTELWELIQLCWGEDPGSRPEAPNVLENLLNLNLPAWKQLINPTISANDRKDLIIFIFSDHGEFEALKQLRGSDAQDFVDVIDEALDSSENLPQEIRRRCLRASYRICGHRALFPRSLSIPLCGEMREDPLYSGAFADVWKDEHDGKMVAVRVLRASKGNSERVRKRLCKEVITWKWLRHPNILPLLGVVTVNRFRMVSEWMPNGNINEFVKDRPNANLQQLLAGANKGLIYMHSREVFHGNLKGSNILIDNKGHARLADFGLITLLPDQSVSSYTGGVGFQWMSPELLDPEAFGLSTGQPTTRSDCYSFGMVVYEVLSGHAPFTSDSMGKVVQKVLNGERPDRPEGEQRERFPDRIWRMLERCWQHEPEDRLGLDAVLFCLQGAMEGGNPPPNTEEIEGHGDEEHEDWSIDFDD